MFNEFARYELVTENSDEQDRQRARELGREQQKTAEPYKAVVSVHFTAR